MPGHGVDLDASDLFCHVGDDRGDGLSMVAEREELRGERGGELLLAVLPQDAQRLVRSRLELLAEPAEVLFGSSTDGGGEEVVERGEVVLNEPGGHARFGRDG